MSTEEVSGVPVSRLVGRMGYSGFTRIEVLLVALILSIIVLIFIGAINDIKRSKKPATVIEKTHTSSSTSYGIMSNGKSGYIFNPEKYELIVVPVYRLVRCCG